MAHFAELSKDNRVLRVIVVDNSDCMKDSVRATYSDLVLTIRSVSGKTFTEGEEVIEWEDKEKGKALCQELLGGEWVQTSYNNLVRERYAGIGYAYDPDEDVFVIPVEFNGH